MPNSLTSSPIQAIGEKLVSLLADFDEYQSPYAQTVGPPDETIHSLVQEASWKSATISATCSLPPGPFGFVSILPELFLIFRIQGHLIKDIAALYGKEVHLTKELFLYIMFKHGSVQLFRTFVEETSIKILIRPATIRGFQSLLQRIGLNVSERFLRKSISRWIPLAGALLTGTFAYRDTKAIGQTAHSVFSKEIVQLPCDADEVVSLPAN